MKRLMMLPILCVVVAQSKAKTGFKTECRGSEVASYVVLDKKIVVGQEVQYRPFIEDDDEIIHGRVVDVHDAEPVTPRVEESSDTGKRP